MEEEDAFTTNGALGRANGLPFTLSQLSPGKLILPL